LPLRRIDLLSSVSKGQCNGKSQHQFSKVNIQYSELKYVIFAYQVLIFVELFVEDISFLVSVPLNETEHVKTPRNVLVLFNLAYDTVLSP
jgi:hypothetical protein